MTTFLQLHLLTTYPASNLNRDDTGSPKSLKFGGVDRLRVSSQSIKRAIRTSDLFATAMGENLGTRSQTFARALVAKLLSKGIEQKEAEKRVREVIEFDKLGKLKSDSVETEQLVHLGADELKRLDELVEQLFAGNKLDGKNAAVLLDKPKAADIAMFGRMLADNPGYNVEAAVQVAHAFTTHRAVVEDDYYTAVDDLKNKDRSEDRGAGFIGIQEYGAGVFYLYICIDADLLVKNLSGEKELAARAARAFIEAAATVSPRGKQNSYASRARATYAMLEVGSDAPRTLAAAFLRPIRPEDASGDVGRGSIGALEALREQFEQAYCASPSAPTIMDVTARKGTLEAILKRAEEAINAASA